ncbi:tRNA (adenosine(37)-N6)-dimethylallyltransferase MiaA [Candidatus Uhrbacteria bacterium]|nr:tRNA (adenosine(37)-N6)-dimethylallyltransferase MiaA [Candidatus Uhrbacteria bacterium]
MSDVLPKVVCVVGPTASGKSTLAIALAQHYQGEIVNADSRQIYRGLEIGTSVPDDLFIVPHHLYAFLDPKLAITVSEWRDMAHGNILSIAGRQKLPLLVGGTGLYIRSIVDNPQYPKVPPQEAWRKFMEQKSLKDLVADLLACDPDAATCVDLKNPRRVLRALEVATMTGTPFTAQKIMGSPLIRSLQIGLRHSPDVLRARMESMVEVMIARGWIDEVQRLIESGVPLDAISMTSIGYPQLVKVIAGEWDLPLAIEMIKKDTWAFAKRQMTWFRRDPRIHWVSDETEAIALVEQFIASQ